MEKRENVKLKVSKAIEWFTILAVIRIAGPAGTTIDDDRYCWLPQVKRMNRLGLVRRVRYPIEDGHRRPAFAVTKAGIGCMDTLKPGIQKAALRHDAIFASVPY